MTWESVLTYAGISALFSAIRTWLSPQKARRLQYFISAMVSIPVGVIVGFLAEDFGFTQGIVFASVAASALIAENIINIVLSFGNKLEKDPVGTIRKVKKLTGK
jgi:uncharacterized membrane protein HdeD (DUF308 family)